MSDENINLYNLLTKQRHHLATRRLDMVSALSASQLLHVQTQYVATQGSEVHPVSDVPHPSNQANTNGGAEKEGVDLNEQYVQRRIIEAHEKRGWMCVKIMQCTVNGFPDLMLLKNGRTVFIEVKRPGVTKAEPLQQYRHRQLRDQGFEVHLTNNIDFLIKE